MGKYNLTKLILVGAGIMFNLLIISAIWSSINKFYHAQLDYINAETELYQTTTQKIKYQQETINHVR